MRCLHVDVDGAEALMVTGKHLEQTPKQVEQIANEKKGKVYVKIVPAGSTGGTSGSTGVAVVPVAGGSTAAVKSGQTKTRFGRKFRPKIFKIEWNLAISRLGNTKEVRSRPIELDLWNKTTRNSTKREIDPMEIWGYFLEIFEFFSRKF